MNIDDERKRFEEWVNAKSVVRFGDASPFKGQYADPFVEIKWTTWKARAALDGIDTKATNNTTHEH